MITNKRFPDQLLVGINNRNPACFDMYRCDVASGKLTLDTENPGDVLGWGTEDESFEVRDAVSRHVRLGLGLGPGLGFASRTVLTLLTTH